MLIRSRFGDYPVREADTLAEVLAATVDSRTWVLADATLASLHDLGPRVVALPSSEATKSWDNLGPLLERLLGEGIRRDGHILAIGGGVVQDVAGFVANLLMRGLRWTFVPSTLLAQADSCIGAKTSVNIGRFKNQLGSFYPPREIWLVPALLDSLPADARRSGLGEVAKFHLLESPEAWEWARGRLTWGDRDHLADLVRRSLAIKQRYIEEDELDRGVRNLLNYGHTFGHAYETATRFAIPHGMAVALGVCTATALSAERGWVTEAHADEVHDALAPLFTPYERHLRDLDLPALRDGLRADKKNIGGATYCILTRGPGRMEKTAVDLDNELIPAIGRFIARRA